MATRLPELVRIRYGRMLVSPFTFYQGAAMIMAADLAAMPRTGLACRERARRTEAGFYVRQLRDRKGSAELLGRGSSFDRASLEFSHAYAEQNNRDYQALLGAIDSGRLKAQGGL